METMTPSPNGNVARTLAARPARRRALRTAAASAAGLLASTIGSPSVAATGKPVRIGYAIARTGPWSAGARASQEPNYLLWAEQQNAAGGLVVEGRRRPVELVGHDDASDVRQCTRAYETMMRGQAVDLVLAPWGTVASSAVAPLANRLGYPLVAPTALSRRLVDMNLPCFFSMLQQADRMMQALVDLLVARQVRTVALLYMDDLFGLENFSALSVALKRAGIEVVQRRDFPLGIEDLSSTLRAMKAQAPDAFIALTYPRETMLVTTQASEVGLRPALFYASVGTAYPAYRTTLGPLADGVLGMGSWNAKSSAGARAYADAHTKRFGQQPDRWASGHCWAGLEILTDCIAQVGLDRAAIRDRIASRTFATIIGPIRFAGSENVSSAGSVGQWQGDEFEVVWPSAVATASLITKPQGKLADVRRGA